MKTATAIRSSCYQLGVEKFSVTKSGFVNNILFNTWGKKPDAFLMKTATAIGSSCYQLGVENFSVTDAFLMKTATAIR